VNSDHQCELKGSKEFQKEDERLFIVQHIKEVDQAFCPLTKTVQYVRPWNTCIINMVVNSNWHLLMEVIKLTIPYPKYPFVNRWELN
jgi:hypothetical protein